MRSSVLSLTLAALVLTACGDDSTGPSNSTAPGGTAAVAMKGIFVGAASDGDIDITIAANAGSAASVGVTGCVYLSAAACTAATGTYVVASKGLTFSTSSPALTFAGTYSNGKVEGGFTGADAGDFVVRDGASVTAYCGTFTGDASGTWNFVISGNALSGVYDDGSGSAALSGTKSGSSVSITFAGGTAAGTLSGATASGSWAAGVDAGTWSGSSSGCRS